MPIISRWASDTLRKGLAFQRAVLLVGARQSGKTTLVRKQCPLDAKYTTLDEEISLMAALNDPHFFVRQANKACLIIDEIQKAPGLISEIKRQVDSDSRLGQYILTGSADYRKLPKANQADSLAGRIVISRLRTLTQGEINGVKAGFLENAFKKRFPHQDVLQPCSREKIYELAIRGGYPQSIYFDEEQRSLYFQSYVNSQILYDLTKTWDLRRYKDLGYLLSILAVFSSKPLNIQDLCRKLSGNSITISSYLSALEVMYLIDELPAWESRDYRIGSKTAKIFLTDTGLMAHLLKIRNPSNLLQSQEKMSNQGGNLVETWVYNQLAAEVDLHPLWNMYHFRNKNNQEIDFLVENDHGDLLGVEVKASESVNLGDFRHLQWFSKFAPGFIGVVLYAGNELLSLGNGMFAVPFSALWADPKDALE